MKSPEDWWIWFDKHILWLDIGINGNGGHHRRVSSVVDDPVDYGCKTKFVRQPRWRSLRFDVCFHGFALQLPR